MMELSSKDTSFIAYLSNFLHANGNEVLVGRKKLSLTSSVLCILNKLYVDPSNDSISKVGNDLLLRENWNFLLNIINNVVALKITHCVETVQGGIDLTMFKSLLMLELKKTPIHLLLGLNEFCSQLEILVCSCSISSLHELLGNRPNSMVWTAMKQLNLAHNYLEDLKEDIQLFPNLQVLDVSHNRLRNANGLKFLTKLCAVNLGYNNLSKIPAFSNESYSCLKELSIRNNSLEDLNGLESIRHICDLDLSYNCLSEHSVLHPIQHLPYLKVLKLIGNPFTVQRIHRIFTAKHLHPNVLIAGINLDGSKLTKTEIGRVTQIRSINMQSISHESINADRTQTNPSFEEVNVNISGNLKQSTIYHPSSSLLDGISVASESSLKTDTRSITSVKLDANKKGISKSKVKKRKEKEIIIQDCGNFQHDNLSEKEECKTQELKATLAARRKNLGQEWLVSTYSSSLPSENILGTFKPFTSRSGSLQRMSDHQGGNVNLDSDHKAIDISIEDTEKELEGVKCFEEKVYSGDEKVLKKISVTSDDIEVICSNPTHQDEIINSNFNVCKSCMHSEQEDNDINFESSGNAYDIKYGITEEDENPESNIFLVDRKVSENTTATIFISIGEKYLNEKDVLSADLLDSLDLSVLDTVEILEKNVIKLEFKIFKVSKRERIYYAESETAAMEILNLLQPLADARNLKNIAKNALRCLKCDTQFTRNILNERFLCDNSHPLASYFQIGNSSSEIEFEEKDICPVCKSLMIVEDHNCPITLNLLKKVNYSPAVISGYLFTSQNTSTLSTDSIKFPANLLLTLKYPPRKKQDRHLNVLDKITVDIPPQGDSVNESDDSSVCTALEYTSLELAGNCSSNNSLDLAHSEDNLNTCVKQLPCATPTTSEQILKHGDNKETNIPQTNIHKEITAFDMSLQQARNVDFKYMIHNIEEITYDTFTTINHTLKLYIEMQLFDANEELEASAEAVIVSHSTTKKDKGLLLLSTKRLHFMKLAKNASDEPDKSIIPLEAVGLNQLHTMLIFIGNQGVSFIFGTEKNLSKCKTCYTCLFRDADYCCSFITYFTDFIKQRIPVLPEIKNCSEYNLNQVKEDIFTEIQNSKFISDISTEILAFLVVEWCWLAASEHETVALILTSTDICIADIVFAKHNKSAKFTKPVESYVPVAKQKITNLISVHPYFESCKVGLHFLDEDSNKELSWVIATKTKQTLYLLINTLKEPWQEKFGVEMKLEAPTDCLCNM